MRWEAPSMPTSAHDPGLLREQEMPLVVGKSDNKGGYFDELILKVLYQLGEIQHNQQISHF